MGDKRKFPWIGEHIQKAENDADFADMRLNAAYRMAEYAHLGNLVKMFLPAKVLRELIWVAPTQEIKEGLEALLDAVEDPPDYSEGRIETMETEDE